MRSFQSQNLDEQKFDIMLSKVRETLGLTHRSSRSELPSPLRTSEKNNFENTFGKSETLCEKNLNVSTVKNNFQNIHEIGTKKEIKQNQDSTARKNNEKNLIIIKQDNSDSKIRIDNIELNILKNELNNYKNKELQYKFEIERLGRQINKLENEKKILIKEIQKKNNKDPNCNNIFKQNDIDLANQLRQCKFIIQQLKLQTTRFSHLDAREHAHTKIFDLEEKVATLLSEKFRLEQKLEYKERLLFQQENIPILVSDSRLKNLRDAIQFWIKKSKKIESQAFEKLKILRDELQNLQNVLMQQNQRFILESKQNLKKFKNNYKLENFRLIQRIKELEQREKLFNCKIAELRVKKKSIEMKPSKSKVKY